jgi:hypothetical protein
MNDDEVLAAARRSLIGVADSLTDVRMDRPVDQLMARARARRLRRGLAAAGVAGVAVAVAAGVAVIPGHNGPASAKAVHVDLAAWSVNTTGTGVVEVTIRQMDNLKLLGKTLQDAGVPSLITSGAICSPRADDVPAAVQNAVIVNPSDLPRGVMIGIRPAAIPAGHEMSISQMGIGGAGGFGVIKAGDQLSCTVVPTYDGPPPPPPVHAAPYPAAHYIVWDSQGK